MPTPLENKLLLYYMSGIGGALGGEGSVAATVGGMTQQQIQTQNFQKFLKAILAGGGKFGMDKEGMNLKAPVGAFRDTEFSIPGFEESYAGVSGAVPEEKLRYPAAYSPSASPLDVSGADLAGLTPENISQALQLGIMKEELERKTVADLARAGYYGAAAKRFEAEAAALTPSIEIPGVGAFTRTEFVKMWTAATKDQRSAALKLYDRYTEQEKGAGREPKSLEEWVIQVAEASGKNLSEILAEFVAKKEAGTELELAGPDFTRDVRADLEKDTMRWGYPPAYEDLVERGLTEPEALDKSQKMMVVEEMERRIKSFYRGKEVERRSDGWYVKGKLVVRNPYGGD